MVLDRVAKLVLFCRLHDVVFHLDYLLILTIGLSHVPLDNYLELIKQGLWEQVFLMVVDLHGVQLDL